MGQLAAAANAQLLKCCAAAVATATATIIARATITTTSTPDTRQNNASSENRISAFPTNNLKFTTSTNGRAAGVTSES